jgi:AcrR family transcriptional regulator
MGRAPVHESKKLLDAAIALAVAGGPSAVTMQGVAAAVGAPSGSIYHRFASRAELLADVWLSAAERFQDDWWTAAEREPSAGEIAAFTVRWARTNRALATILSVHRVEDFLTPEAPPDQQRRARALRAARARFAQLAERLLGTNDSAAVARLVFALVTIPLAALRDPLSAGAPIDHDVEDLVREAASALARRA